MSFPGEEEGAREEVQPQGAEGNFAHPWATTKRCDLRGLSGYSGSGTMSGGATVWTPACYAGAVRGKCSQESGDAGTDSLRR